MPGAPRLCRVQGAAVVYRLYDIGYGINLERALDILASSAPERVRPVRGEAQAIQIKNPPVTVILGTERVTIRGRPHDVELSARLFDFGVVSLRARIPAGELSWAEFSAFGAAVSSSASLPALFVDQRRMLSDRIASAIDRPQIAPVERDYIVFRITDALDERSERLSAEALSELDVVPLLLEESRPLSADARRELLPHRFSYYTDDLAILTWDNALIVDPSSGDTDVEFLLEFANAQLLELLYYDAVLDAELPRMYERIAAARRHPLKSFARRLSPVLSDLQSLVADTTELIERVENSLKVTDDVYLARVYSAAIEIFRGRDWREGIDHKLTIIRETYAMLNAEAQTSRAELLELSIVLLIVFEIVLAFFR